MWQLPLRIKSATNSDSYILDLFIFHNFLYRDFFSLDYFWYVDSSFHLHLLYISNGFDIGKII